MCSSPADPEKAEPEATLQLTFTADAELTFNFEVSFELNYDCFAITYDGAEKVEERRPRLEGSATLSAESGRGADADLCKGQ